MPRGLLRDADDVRLAFARIQDGNFQQPVLSSLRRKACQSICRWTGVHEPKHLQKAIVLLAPSLVVGDGDPSFDQPFSWDLRRDTWKNDDYHVSHTKRRGLLQ